MIKLARIIKNDLKIVQLVIESNDKCATCKAGCSKGFMGFLFSQNSTLSVSKKGILNANTHLIDNADFFSKHNKVDEVIGMKFEENQLIKLTSMLYGLPIVLIVISLISFYYLFLNYQLNQDVGGIVGLIIGLLFSKVILKLNQVKLKPQVEFFK